MVRGLDEGLLGDLWNFPAAFGPTRAEALARLQQKLPRFVRGEICLGTPLGEIRHRITYRAIRVDLYPVETDESAGANGFRWLSFSRLPHAAVSQLARKIAAKL
jgi:adenine-specific DNA glycosylase